MEQESKGEKIEQGSAARGLTIVRIALGVFWLAQASGKLGYLANPGLLTKELVRYLEKADPIAKLYLEYFCMPGVEVLARLVVLGELACGIALLLGLYTRWAAVLGLFLCCSYKLASSGLFWHIRFLSDAFALPLFATGIALILVGDRLPWSIRTRLPWSAKN